MVGKDKIIHLRVDHGKDEKLKLWPGIVAGLMAAIRASDFVPRVILVDKAKVAKSGCSPFAAGIYNAVLPEDDIKLWMKEIIEAGDYISHQDWVKQQAEQGFFIVKLMDEWSHHYRLPIFEKDERGRFQRRKSRGHIHSSHLVVNSLPMLEVLRLKALEKGVELLERVMVTDLLAHDVGAQGLVGFNYRTGQIIMLKANAVVLAAGGCRFKSILVGHKNLTGDLQAAALRAGAVFKNFEHANSNTCYKGFDIHGMNLFVNVGGRFLNRLNQEFMWD
jgi:succinate dehydrogenase/fumarate reductase flavoprotein subunit